MSKYKQDFYMVISKYRRMYVKGQFVFSKKVLKLRDFLRKLRGFTIEASE